MKKAVTVLSIIFSAVIVFFSIFGERLYYSTKPKVELERPLRIDGALLAPESAVFHDAGGSCIVCVESEQGFSVEILTTRKIRLAWVRPDSTGYYEGYVLVQPQTDPTGPIVINSTRPLRGGQRVVEG